MVQSLESCAWDGRRRTSEKNGEEWRCGRIVGKGEGGEVGSGGGGGGGQEEEEEVGGEENLGLGFHEHVLSVEQRRHSQRLGHIKR